MLFKLTHCKRTSCTVCHHILLFVLLLGQSIYEAAFIKRNSPDSAKHLEQIFLRQPVDQTAIQAEHVTLPCQVENKRGPLQWTRDGFGLGVERNLTGFDRYHMIGSDEEGKLRDCIFLTHIYIHVCVIMYFAFDLSSQLPRTP